MRTDAPRVGLSEVLPGRDAGLCGPVGESMSPCSRPCRCGAMDRGSRQSGAAGSGPAARFGPAHRRTFAKSGAGTAFLNGISTSDFIEFNSASSSLGISTMPPKPACLASAGFALMALVAICADGATAQELHSVPANSPAPFSIEALIPAFESVVAVPATSTPNVAVADSGVDAAESAALAAIVDRAIYKAPRKRVADFALTLRDIRYRRAGRDPSTGFDCSGFTHYVYNKTFGVELPYDAPSQYRDGEKIARDEMKMGDLVFFQVRNRITHVGIYMGDGRFIHSPSPGKRVRIDELASPYWAKRWAGARRVHGFS
ncbi:MAG: C40 family peptidase [Proteobacteria bacterium]|nr:C40 family peptidase [Pseudomonadota bacterium]